MKNKKIQIDPISLFSHELKTPLSSLKLALNILKNNPEPQKRKEFLSLMEEELDQLIDFICNHLDVKLLKDNTFIQPKWVSLDDILSNAVKSFHLIAKEKNISIKVLSANDELEVFADSLWFCQAIKNILSNAVKFSPNQSTILINYQLEDDYIKISVDDEGKGFSKKEENDLSKDLKFKKEDPIFLKNTGFGLNIVNLILKNHDGFLKVSSNNKKGARVSLCIPNFHLVKKSA